MVLDEHLTGIIIAFLLAGMVKGVSGLGLPTVVLGLLTLVMSPSKAAALIIIPSVLTNIWQAFAGGRLLPLAKRLRWMLLGICAGTAAAAVFVSGHAPEWTSVALGLVMLIYGLIGVLAVRFRVPAQAEPWAAPLAGVCGGAITAATGSYFLPTVPYLQALDFSPDELIQAMGIAFMASITSLGIVLYLQGALSPSVAATSVVAMVPAFVGMYVGQQIRKRISAEMFKRLFFLAVLLLGAHLTIDSLVKMRML
ncbi:MAG: sulfite exporter TauE/SafE family protein [Candidatus Protistobacter heckmanni]|nr:sulfite exporter TauE/SafE family protein [Candidatus Protistobacter heckmanni]